MFTKKYGTGAVAQQADPGVKIWTPDADFFTQSSPVSVDWTSRLPQVWNQNPYNTCESNAGSLAAIDFLTHRKGVSYFMPARAFTNWNARVISKRTLGKDDGCAGSDVMKALMTTGLADEPTYCYSTGHIVDQFWGLVKVGGPSDAAYKSGAKHRVLSYSTLTNARSAQNPNIYDIELFKQCLAAGNTFWAGIIDYSKLLNTNGVLVIPDPSLWGKIFAAHAVLIVGYDVDGLIFRNSWGASWGNRGNGKIPWAFAQNPFLLFEALVIDDMS